MLPVRPLRGPAPHEVLWQPADGGRILHILKNPTYAGAYVYGRRRQDPSRGNPATGRCGTAAVPLPEWPVCLQDAHPGYIGWEEFMANQQQLSDNLHRYGSGRPGRPRQGRALLQGIAVCGRCGRRMSLAYSGPGGNYPVYRCAADKERTGTPRCQEVRGLPVDAEVERLVLMALAPDKVALAVAALGELDAEVRLLERQWSLRLERARYETERARRQYDAVEPENRLVARSLERIWETKLRVQEDIEQEHERWRAAQPPVSVSPQDRTLLLALGEDLPRVWHAATTTAVDRKRILRLLVQEVVLDQKRQPGQIYLRIIWQTGASSEHWLRRRVRAYDDHADLAQLEGRIRDLNGAGKIDAEIAAVLNAEGFLSTRGTAFDHGLVHLLRKRWRIPTVKINGTAENPQRWPDGSYSVQGVATALGITPQTVFKWLRAGQLVGRQCAKGMPWQIMLGENQLVELHASVRRITPSRRKAS